MIKNTFFDLEADTLDLGSLDHEKEKCFWNFFHILQKDPYQVQITLSWFKEPRSRVSASKSKKYVLS